MEIIVDFRETAIYYGHMNPKDLIEFYGTQVAAARARNLDKQLIHGWIKRGSIPLAQQCKYEVVSGGQLKADIPPELRQPANLAKTKAPQTSGVTGKEKHHVSKPRISS